MRMSLFLLLLLLPSAAACGSSPSPVAPPETVTVPANECTTFQVQSFWGGRTPLPATNVTARAEDTALARAVVEGNQVHVFASGTGTTRLELRYTDPATKREEERTVVVDVRTPKPKDAPYPMEDKTHARCDELRTRLGASR